jgi:hypothetical protein
MTEKVYISAGSHALVRDIIKKSGLSPNDVCFVNTKGQLRGLSGITLYVHSSAANLREYHAILEMARTRKINVSEI